MAGVAIAAIISQYVSAILTLLRLKRYQDFDFSFQSAKPDWKTNRDLFRLGIPSGIMQSMFAVSMLFVQSLTNQINIADISTMVIRVDGFAMLPNFTFGIAMATFTGQNVGAGKMHRLKQGVKQGLAVALVTTITLTGLLIVFGKNIMRLFTKTEANVELAYSMMLVLTVGYNFCHYSGLGGIMRSRRYLAPMWVTIFNNIVFRIPMAYLIAHLTKSAEWPHGQPISTLAIGTDLVHGHDTVAIFFKRGRWKDKVLSRQSDRQEMSFRPTVLVSSSTGPQICYNYGLTP